MKDIYKQLNNKQRALLYCEEYGIIEPHKITRQTLVYYTNYPAYLSEPRRTYKVKVKLSTMEETRILLKKWTSKGNYNYRK